MIRKKIPLTAAFGAILTGLLSGVSFAADFSLKPTISGEASYNDNVFLTTTSKLSSWRAVVYPGLNLNYNVSNISVDAYALAGINRYINNSELNTEDQLYRFNTTYATGQYDLNLKFNYNKIATLRTETLDTGDLQGFARQRETLLLSPSLLYRLSERTHMTLSYLYRSRSYTDPSGNAGSSTTSTNGANLVGTEMHGANILLNHSITDRLKFGSAFEYAHVSADTGVVSDSFMVRLPLDYDYSETFRTSVAVGGRYTMSSINGDDKGGDAGFLFGFKFLKKFEIGKVNISLSRDLYPSGLGTLNQKDQALVNMDASLSDTITAGIAMRYLRNEVIGGESVSSSTSNFRNREYVQVGPTLRWQWAKDWSIGTGYLFSSQQIKNNPDFSGDGNTFFVNVGYSFEEIFLPD